MGSEMCIRDSPSSWHAYIAMNTAENLYIAPGRSQDFFLQMRTGVSNDPVTFPFRIHDNGKAKFEHGQSDAVDANADLPGDVIFFVSGSTDNERNAVFGGNAVVSGSLTAGEIGINEKLVHNGDTNTYLAFSGQNEIDLVANGHSFLKYNGDILINNANRDRDTKIMADDGNVVLHVDAGVNSVGIGTTSPTSIFHVNGATSAAIVTKNANYVATVSDSTILIDASSSSVTITLPAVSGTTGRIYTIKCIAKGGGQAANLATNSSEQIDGSSNNVVLNNNQSLTIQSSGSAWYKIAEFMGDPP